VFPGSLPPDLNLLVSGAMSDRLHAEVDDYGPEVWLSSSASAVRYEPGCVLTLPLTDHQLRRETTAETTSTPFWALSRSPYGNDHSALFRGAGGGSRQFADQHFYDQRLTPTTAAVSLQPPSSNCVQQFSHHHAYDNCEYVDLQPFQRGPPPPSYPAWLPASAGDGCVVVNQQVPFGLSGCPPGSSVYGPPPVELPYSPTAWLHHHVKAEQRRSSSSAAESSVDGGTFAAAGVCAPTTPTSYKDGQLKQEMLVTGTVECSSSCDDVVRKDDWTFSGRGGGGGQSDASQSSSVEQLSDAVCQRPVCVFFITKNRNLSGVSTVT